MVASSDEQAPIDPPAQLNETPSKILNSDLDFVETSPTKSIQNLRFPESPTLQGRKQTIKFKELSLIP